MFEHLLTPAHNLHSLVDGNQSVCMCYQHSICVWSGVAWCGVVRSTWTGSLVDCTQSVCMCVCLCGAARGQSVC